MIANKFSRDVTFRVKQQHRCNFARDLSEVRGRPISQGHTTNQLMLHIFKRTLRD